MRWLLLLACLLGIAWAADLRVASFNIQVFGVTKMAKPGVAPILVNILRRYDISLIQEIRDSTGTAILALWSQINASLPFDQQYSLVLSERLGRTNSKEQYAYFYKPSLVSILATYQYPVALDEFERPPFSIHVQFGSITFGISGCHVSPDDARVEIANLNLATGAVATAWDEPNMLVMGDFNAGCTYITYAQLAVLSFREFSNYTWLINDTADTTAGPTDCPYDRFVVTTDFLPQYVNGTAMPFDFATAYGLNSSMTLDVSDHYPIEMTLAVSTPAPIRTTLSPSTPLPTTGSPSPPSPTSPPSPPPPPPPLSSTSTQSPMVPSPGASLAANGASYLTGVASSTLRPGTGTPQSSSRKKKATAMIVGITIGCIVAAALIVGIVVYFVVFKARKADDDSYTLSLS